MERCRDRSTTEGTQIQPIALAMVKRLKEREEFIDESIDEFIQEGRQKNQLLATPDNTATET
jgi:hypothetical protein